jgi:hypothetical protein
MPLPIANMVRSSLFLSDQCLPCDANANQAEVSPVPRSSEIHIPKRRKSEGYRGISLLQSQFIEEQFWAQPSILVVLNEEKSLTVGVTFFTWLFERNLNPGFYGSPLMSIPSDRVTRSDPPAPELIQKIRSGNILRSGERFLQVL